MSATEPGPRAQAFKLAEGIVRELAQLTVNARARPDASDVSVPRAEFVQLRDLHTRALAVAAELDRTDRERS